MIFQGQKLDAWFSLEVLGLVPTRQSHPNSHFGFVLILALFEISCVQYISWLVSIHVFLLYVISLAIILGHKSSHNFPYSQQTKEIN